jgi:pyruvate dehydrogenase E2 component (dihydrolipoamide acetyltransferase)
MAKEVIMPRFGMTQEEATIVRWIVQNGEQVEFGDPLCEVTTDKVNMEVDAPADGVLDGIRYAEGDTVAVTEIIAFVLAEGESVPEIDGPESPDREKNPPVQPLSSDRTIKATPVARRMADHENIELGAIPGSGNSGRITRQDVRNYLDQYVVKAAPGESKMRASPAARRIARQEGIELNQVPGSGPRGRVQGWDLDQVTLPSQSYPTGSQPIAIQLHGMRRTIAERMQSSWQTIPHITFSLEIEMSRAIAMRQEMNTRPGAEKPGISISAVLVKACAAALRQHPLLNSYFREDEILIQPDVNVGLAVALEDGLIVPVVHQADQKNLFQIGAEVGELSKRAREGGLRPQDVMDGTFTISNLGMFAVDQFTAIINPPQVAILAVGRTVERFLPDESRRPVLRPMMIVTLSADHRVVDGAEAARFLSTFQGILETAGAQWA